MCIWMCRADLGMDTIPSDNGIPYSPRSDLYPAHHDVKSGPRHARLGEKLGDGYKLYHSFAASSLLLDHRNEARSTTRHRRSSTRCQRYRPGRRGQERRALQRRPAELLRSDRLAFCSWSILAAMAARILQVAALAALAVGSPVSVVRRQARAGVDFLPNETLRKSSPTLTTPGLN